MSTHPGLVYLSSQRSSQGSPVTSQTYGLFFFTHFPHLLDSISSRICSLLDRPASVAGRLEPPHEICRSLEENPTVSSKYARYHLKTWRRYWDLIVYSACTTATRCMTRTTFIHFKMPHHTRHHLTPNTLTLPHGRLWRWTGCGEVSAGWI